MAQIRQFLQLCGFASFLAALAGILTGSALGAACFGAVAAGLFLYPNGFEKGRHLGVYETVDALLDHLPSDQLPPAAPKTGRTSGGDQLWPEEIPAPVLQYQAGRPPVDVALLGSGIVEGGELVVTLGHAAVRGRTGLEAPAIKSKLSELGHILIGGAPRSGKSVMTRAIVFQALLANFGGNGEIVQVAGVDLTGITLNPALFEGLPQLFGGKIAGSPAEADELLEKIEAEVERREGLFRQVHSLPEKLAEYNAVATTGAKLPFVIVVVEEFGALSLLMGRAWQSRFTSLVWRVAKYGFHFVCLSQDLTKATVGACRDAFLARVWFREIPAPTRQMLGFRDEAGVSRNEPGRGIMKLADRELEFQGILVEKQQLIDLVKLLKEREVPPDEPKPQAGHARDVGMVQFVPAAPGQAR